MPTLQDLLPETNSELEVADSLPELDKDSLLNYTECHDRLQKLYDNFRPVIDQCMVNRALRKVDIDLQKERKSKRLKEDELLVPVRVIDTNIRRETPPMISYLKQSKRIMTFKALNDPNFIPDQLEIEFCNGMTYPKWEKPWMKIVDGSKTHGFDWVEVTYDESKPFKVAIEHIGRDRMVFPVDAEDLQNCELVARIFKVSPRQLKLLVKEWDFNADQVNLILDKDDKRRKELTIEIFKVMFKIDNVVWVGWDSLDKGHSDWLKTPQKLFLGRRTMQQVPNPQLQQPGLVNRLFGVIGVIPPTINQWVDVEEPTYPIFLLPYQETEEHHITDVEGRVFMDKHKQEAATSNLSSFLNNMARTANVYACVDSNSDEGASKLQAAKMEHGKIIERPLKFYTPPAANPAMLAAAQYLDTLNAAEAGQVSYAVNNRPDTEKTATEVKSARADQGLLNSVPLTLFSATVREVYSFIWPIVQSQALQNKISLLQINGVNDYESISKNFELRAAGDVDVIERQELIAKHKEFWPIVAGTPLAGKFLERLLKLSFPEDGEAYSKILSMGDPTKLLIIAGQIIEGMFKDHPELINAIPPQEQQQLAEFINAISGIMQTQQQMQQGEVNKARTGQATTNPAAKPRSPEKLSEGGANGGMGNAG